ncbi:hypothetical protein SAMN05421819_3922 [Bryocella elongata]|uniref:Uncharacterized protein n=1 Tax=Bryocella elongata TaxID=863522 RepID=A0A1H6BQ66_9BACT|nr:hypothetical protein [Bryocella elongata]SEG62834.1 hypothetical protein SAMN05421819_3922 [Bryocella elongata]
MLSFSCCIISFATAISTVAQTRTTLQFPSRTFATNGGDDGNFLNEWFSSELNALGERPMVELTTEISEEYRFTLLPSFSKPIAVRVEIKKDGTGTATSEIGDWAGGYAPKSGVTRKTRALSRDEILEIHAVVADFWKISAVATGDPGGEDGTEWIMEGNDGQRYHAAYRWEGSVLTPIGRYFLADVAQLRDEAMKASASVARDR